MQPSRPLLPLITAMALALTACGTAPINTGERHLKHIAPPTAGDIPKPVQQTQLIPPPKPAPKAETYSVVVNNVPAQELLFALARDARLNIDIHPGLQGSISLNAIDQTLPQILNRIAKQIDMRWELDGPNLSVMPDGPFLRNYKIDYVNVAREAQSALSTSTQIASTGSRGAVTGGATTGGNSSSTSVNNIGNNRFWETLVQNVRDLLRETDKMISECGNAQDGASSAAGGAGGNAGGSGAAGALATASNVRNATATATAAATGGAPGAAGNTPAGQAGGARSNCLYRELASVIPNPESGMVAVRATSRQHEKVQEFIDQVMNNARRQVMIEATIVEVELNDGYQSGVDWQKLSFGSGLNFRQNTAGIDLSNSNAPVVDSTRMKLISDIMGDTNLTTQQKSNLVNQIAPGMGTLMIDASGNLVAAGTPGSRIPYDTTKAFSSQGSGFTMGYANGEKFAGAIKLLSTFGNVKVLSSPRLTVLNNQAAVLRVVQNEVYFTIGAQSNATNGVVTTTYTSTPNTVAVGFVMSVQPQIDDNSTVTLNLRPSISRITGYVKDPNPDLARVNVTSLVPVIQTREIESIMKVPSGQIAVLGGLMQDYAEKNTTGLPGASNLPVVGQLFGNRDDKTRKTELVIFMRPVAINDASIDGDFRSLRSSLPDNAFFDDLTAKRPTKTEAQGDAQ